MAGDGSGKGGGFEGLATEPLSEADRNHTLVQRFRLRVGRGPDENATYVSDGARTVVGTHQSANFVLSDRAVSRFHCELTCDDGRVTVKDLGSRNGVLVDGVAVVEGHLHHGAVVTVGRTQLQFELPQEMVAIRLSDRTEFGLMVGRSPATRALFAELERAAASDSTVLLQGETGTGKEVAAESIHRESQRRDGPFIVVDCGAVPGQLLESELFGHERGAFTGATAARMGAFEAANGGTILLDEIGELNPELQPKLLRVLERREVKRVGASQYSHVDVRVIAATHRDLSRLVNEREFRSDLYYRLAVLETRIPPLRDRKGDLPVLVERLVGRLRLEQKEADALRSNSFLAELARHTWPGNVRELRNYLERCAVLQEQAPLSADPRQKQQPWIDIDKPLKAARDEWTRTFERQYLEQIVRQHGGNISAAARAAEVDRIYFYRLLWRHGLK